MNRRGFIGRLAGGIAAAYAGVKLPANQAELIPVAAVPVTPLAPTTTLVPTVCRVTSVSVHAAVESLIEWNVGLDMGDGRTMDFRSFEPIDVHPGDLMSIRIDDPRIHASHLFSPPRE